MQQIATGLYTCTGLPVGRVYVSVDSDGLTVIDTSVGGSERKILAQIAALGHQPSAIKRILITHAHPDHIGALPALKATTGARVYASAGERPVIEGNMAVPTPPPTQVALPWRLMIPPPTTFSPTQVDVELGDGDTIPGALGGLVALHTPGHAPGHLSFWQPERRILFCGDVFFNLFNRIGPPFSMVTVDASLNRRSMQRLAELRPEIICFGHGPIITQHASSRLSAFAATQH